MIAGEFRRVLKPDELVVSVQGVLYEGDEFERAGFREITDRYLGKMLYHPLSQMGEYRWKVQVWVTI